ncbi:hypothetical protein B0H16DRAFT_7896 [Mycena metata]|uniref:Uncharacterized protein n=1 Tax=Mycena metata TaxID=1033252 RepID=A0AAD7KHP7_9AGAR|nr:hypothetical protein B0H16DRAFT_7896 [Mycena metata]
MAQVIQAMEKILALPAKHTKEVRASIQLLLEAKLKLDKKPQFFKAWDVYTLSRKDRTVKKRPNAFRWLCKVVAIREHFLRIAGVATSVTLAHLLLHDIDVEIVDNPIPKVALKLDEPALQEILNAAINSEVLFDDSKSTRDFLNLQRLVNLCNAESSLNRPVHCECRLLAHIHRKVPAVPYIGVSKLSCGYCDAYFEAYRKITESKICTRGSHGQSASWTCPVLPEDPDSDSNIRKEVCSMLLQKIRIGWAQYRRSSLDSQRTSASGVTESNEVALDELIDKTLGLLGAF